MTSELDTITSCRPGTASERSESNSIRDPGVKKIGISFWIPDNC